MKQIVKDYLNFTRRERIGVISVVFLLLFIFFLPQIIARKNKVEIVNTDTAWLNTMKKLERSNPDSNAGLNRVSSYSVDAPESDDEAGNPPGTLFYFNPNTISAEDWKRLGIRDKTIRTIRNYLSKGGSFKRPGDLQKIYGFSKTDYERLLPYIKIETIIPPALQQEGITEEAKKEPGPYKKPDYGVIELNTADTTQLISLPGIGSKLANRIISFRDKLGGFYSVEQIKETYGLQDSVFQKLKKYLVVDGNSIRKININKVSLDELKQHPYFRFTIANPVILYRKEHGDFSKTEDLKKVMAVTDEVFNKISPYIITQ